MSEKNNACKNWYTIYNAFSDDLLASGTRHDCARQMGWQSAAKVDETIKAIRRGYVTRYAIVVENLQTGQMQSVLPKMLKRKEKRDFI